jgi:GNAT superfamily N-acetyltransferase
MKVKHLYDALEHVQEIATCLYAEWPDMYQKLMNLNSAEELETVLRKRYAVPRMLPSGYVIMDDEDKEFIGFGSLQNNTYFKNHEFLNFRDFVWLTQMFIKPEYRKQGIGSTFLDNICVVAATQFDKKNMVLWTNKLSILPFYEKNKFELVESAKLEGFDFEVLHRHTVAKEPILQPAHFIGLAVIILIIYALKIVISFIRHLFTF